MNHFLIGCSFRCERPNMPKSQRSVSKPESKTGFKRPRETEDMTNESPGARVTETPACESHDNRAVTMTTEPETTTTD